MPKRLGFNAASAAVLISDDRGGKIGSRERICATSSAQLGFHAAAKKDLLGRQVSSPEGTQLVWDAYPGDVRHWITHHGGLSAEMVFLKGRELESMVRSCHSPVSRAKNRSDIGEM